MARFLQVFVAQGIIFLFFIYIAYKIISQKKARLNLTFGMFYICIATAIIVNMIYALIFDEQVVLILNFVVNFLTAFGIIFLLSTNNLLLKSTFEFTVYKEVLLILVYGAFLFCMIFFLPFGGVKINAGTNWKPVWSLSFYLYVIIILTVGAIIPTIYTSIKIYLDFTNEQLKRKWLFYFIGIIGLFVYLYGAFTINYLNDDTARLVFSIFGISVLLWAYMVYYGIIRQLKSNE